MNTGTKERRASARGRTLGARPLVPLGRLPKGLAVRAKPPAAATAEMDIHPVNKNLVGYQAAKIAAFGSSYSQNRVHPEKTANYAQTQGSP